MGLQVYKDKTMFINGIIDTQVQTAFTREEKQALLKYLMSTMYADNEAAFAEKDVLQNIINYLSITQSDATCAERMDASKAISVLRNLPLLKKVYFAKFLSLIIIADGTIHPAEQQMWKLAEQQVGIYDIEEMLKDCM